MESLLLQTTSFPFASVPSLSYHKLKTGSSSSSSSRRFVKGLAVVRCGNKEMEKKAWRDEEWKGIDEEWKGNCRGREGLVELIECLEREAIMGDDQGTQPADYNRRALIFDMSSTVFKDLKLNSNQPPPPPSSS